MIFIRIFLLSPGILLGFGFDLDLDLDLVWIWLDLA